MVDEQILRARLERLREYLALLESVYAQGEQRFLQDPLLHGSAERYLHLALECVLDIGNHIIADRCYRKPGTYAEVFEILENEKVISKTLLQRLEGMPAFRNLLVHDYLRLDHGRVFKIMGEKLPVLRELSGVYAALLS